MSKKLKRGLVLVTVSCAVALFGIRGYVSFAQENSVEDLKKQIEALQKRVEDLESSAPVMGARSAGDPLGVLPKPTRRWDPFEEITRMQEEMDRMVQDSFRWGGPAGKGMFRSHMFYDDSFDIKEAPDSYRIEFDMTGLNAGTIDIQVNQQSLTVRGERAQEHSEEGRNNYIASKSFATFMRSFPVPPDADTSKMKTENQGDKLIITLPKKEGSR